jgi:hypothetical protein
VKLTIPQLLALLDAHIRIAEQDKVDMASYERRKGTSYWDSKLEWLTFARAKVRELKEGK